MQRLILGVLDHGSRALLTLNDLADKRSLTILRVLIALFRHTSDFSKPSQSCRAMCAA